MLPLLGCWVRHGLQEGCLWGRERATGGALLTLLRRSRCCKEGCGMGVPSPGRGEEWC